MGISKDTTTLLKGGAALWVILYHLNQLIPIPFIGSFFEINGMMHVGIFFFLSGYGLTKSYYSNPNNFLKSFWIKRFIYFLLPFWFINGIYTILWASKWEGANQLFTYIIGYKYINPHAWFIGTLFTLYILFFIVVLLRKYKVFKIEYAFLVLFLIYLVFGLLKGQRLFLSSINFFIGMLIATHENSIYHLAIKYKVKLLTFLISFFAVLCILMMGRSHLYDFLHRPLFVFNSAVFVLLIYCLIISNNYFRNLKLKFLLWIGTFSYELYLIHKMYLHYIDNNNKLLSYIFVYFFSIISAFVLNKTLALVQNKIAFLINKK